MLSREKLLRTGVLIKLNGVLAVSNKYFYQFNYNSVLISLMLRYRISLKLDNDVVWNILYRIHAQIKHTMDITFVNKVLNYLQENNIISK